MGKAVIPFADAQNLDQQPSVAWCLPGDMERILFDFVKSVFGETMHLKRVGSLADAAIGFLYAEELILHKIGAGLAAAKGLDKKHTTKQIDRLLSNKKFEGISESFASCTKDFSIPAVARKGSLNNCFNAKPHKITMSEYF